jgi:hypothetical protein
MPVVPPAVAHPRDAVVALARDAGMAPASGARRTAVGAAAHLPGSAEERAAWLVGLRQIVDAAEATFTAVLADFDAAGEATVVFSDVDLDSYLALKAIIQPID